jgi:hypothetical protein
MILATLTGRLISRIRGAAERGTEVKTYLVVALHASSFGISFSKGIVGLGISYDEAVQILNHYISIVAWDKDAEYKSWKRYSFRIHEYEPGFETGRKSIQYWSFAPDGQSLSKDICEARSYYADYGTCKLHFRHTESDQLYGWTGVQWEPFKTEGQLK